MSPVRQIITFPQSRVRNVLALIRHALYSRSLLCLPPCEESEKLLLCLPDKLGSVTSNKSSAGYNAMLSTCQPLKLSHDLPTLVVFASSACVGSTSTPDANLCGMAQPTSPNPVGGGQIGTKQCPKISELLNLDKLNSHVYPFFTLPWRIVFCQFKFVSQAVG